MYKFDVRRSGTKVEATLVKSDTVRQGERARRASRQELLESREMRRRVRAETAKIMVKQRAKGRKIPKAASGSQENTK